MKKPLFWILAAAGAFFAWQWHLSKTSKPAQALEADQDKARTDQVGRMREAAGELARPRLASDEAADKLFGFLANPSPQTAMAIVPDKIKGNLFSWGWPSAAKGDGPGAAVNMNPNALLAGADNLPGN
jgi:hypothetical protein